VIGSLAESADENFAVHVRHAASGTKGMRVVDGDGLLMVDSGLACDTFNFVCRARLEPGAAPRRAREAIEWFARARRPFSWWVGPADRPPTLGRLLEAAGLERAETELAMAADLAAPRQPAARSGLEIRRITTAAGLAEFARINAANWSPPDAGVLRFYRLTARRLLAPDSPQWYFLGTMDGESVATAELTIGGGVAGLYNICTLEQFRRRGIGTALLAHALEEAALAGCRTAVLQAASAGVGIYRSAGFEVFGEITEFKPRAGRE
jgi:ribosomal protein S18 acetylase RimI-like enzyme